VAQTYYGIQAQNQAAAQARAYGAQAAASANAAALESYGAIQDAEIERQMEIAQRKTMRLRQGLRERAFIRAGLAEGVGSARSLVAAGIAESEDIGALEFTRESAVAQGERQKRGVFAQTQSRLNEIESQVRSVAPVSPGLAALQLGLAGFTGYNQGLTYQAKYGGSSNVPAAPSRTNWYDYLTKPASIVSRLSIEGIR
jgi:hypothetical protein